MLIMTFFGHQMLRLIDRNFFGEIHPNRCATCTKYIAESQRVLIWLPNDVSTPKRLIVSKENDDLNPKLQLRVFMASQSHHLAVVPSHHSPRLSHGMMYLLPIPKLRSRSQSIPLFSHDRLKLCLAQTKCECAQTQEYLKIRHECKMPSIRCEAEQILDWGHIGPCLLIRDTDPVFLQSHFHKPGPHRIQGLRHSPDQLQHQGPRQHQDLRPCRGPRKTRCLHFHPHGQV